MVVVAAAAARREEEACTVWAVSQIRLLAVFFNPLSSFF